MIMLGDAPLFKAISSLEEDRWFAERELKNFIRMYGIESKAVEARARDVCLLNDVDPDLIVDAHSSPPVRAWHEVVRRANG